MGLPFFVVVCWVFVAGDNSGFNLEQHMTRVEALAQPEKGLFIDLIAQHEGLADELAQPEQEPQVRTGDCLRVGVCASEGHKIQAQRPWVGLADEEIEEAYAKPTLRKMYQAIEAKLKEKNT